MGRYSTDQLTSAEKYFKELELEDIPLTTSSNKRELFLLKSMTQILKYCSKELIARGLDNIDKILREKRLQQLPSLIMETPAALYYHPFPSLIESTVSPLEYESKRFLLRKEHLELPRQIVETYILLKTLE